MGDTEHWITISKHGIVFFPLSLSKDIVARKIETLSVAFNKDSTKMLLIPNGPVKLQTKKNTAKEDKFNCSMLKILSTKNILKESSLRYPGTVSDKGILIDLTKPKPCFDRQTVHFTHEIAS